ncbi:hypothetical protein B0H12DRAFT_98562 [Mycena haematopus]|nr:hypothetical protein B0H12DRAFT_98562 [Mycena haematopus]
MLRPRSVLTFGIVLFLSVARVHGQAGSDQLFEWGFSGPQAVSTSLPSCRTFPMFVKPLAVHGVPPFYMTAFAVGGAPITTLIGTNTSNLAWTVQHPIGTQLFLAVVDSAGNSGGVDPPLYTVIEGASTQCIPGLVVGPPFSITANVTDTLTTCQPWGLTIHGGMPPYNVTLAALNASEVTNATLGPNDSVFTYINRAEAGTQMIASVSDLNGRWATGSPSVHTQGSTDVDCPGLVSTSSSAPGNETHAGISRTKKIEIIVGAAAGTVLLLFGLWTWAIRLRRSSVRPLSADSIVSPFQIWPAGRIAISPVSSALLAKKHSHSTMPVALTPTGSSSPTTSPPFTVRELPPPYAQPWLHQYELCNTGPQPLESTNQA